MNKSNTEVPEELRLKLANYLNEIRDGKNIGFNQLSLKSEVNPGVLTKILNGTNKKINPYQLMKLASALKVDYKELYKIVGYLEEAEEVKEKIENREKGNAVKLAHKIIELPVYGKASAGPGYINLDNQISTKRVIANGFSPDSFIVKVTEDSMSYEINDGDWAVVDPQQRDYVENKVYVVTYEEETFIKQIVCPTKGMVILKSFNGKCTDKYVMKEKGKS